MMFVTPDRTDQQYDRAEAGEQTVEGGPRVCLGAQFAGGLSDVDLGLILRVRGRAEHGLARAYLGCLRTDVDRARRHDRQPAVGDRVVVQVALGGWLPDRHRGVDRGCSPSTASKAEHVRGEIGHSDAFCRAHRRAYLVERGLEQDGYSALKSLVADYLEQAELLAAVPMSVCPLESEADEEAER